MNSLSQNNHTENKDQEIAGVSIKISVINTSVDMPGCTSMEDIQAATHEDVHL